MMTFILEMIFFILQVRIVSAHRTPQMMFDYALSAQERGVQLIIAGAGGAAHLPGGCHYNKKKTHTHTIVHCMSILSSFTSVGMVAALTPLPVIGVPVRASTLDGLDSLLSIVQVILVNVQQFFFRQSWHLYWLLKLLLRNWWMTAPVSILQIFLKQFFLFFPMKFELRSQLENLLVVLLK